MDERAITIIDRWERNASKQKEKRNHPPVERRARELALQDSQKKSFCWPHQPTLLLSPHTHNGRTDEAFQAHKTTIWTEILSGYRPMG